MDIDAIVERLDRLILDVAPDATRVAKYGGTLYTLQPDEKEGQFCGVFAYKAHVQLSFARGAELADPDGVLEGNGKLRRHLTFKAAADVDERGVKRLLRSAAKL